MGKKDDSELARIVRELTDDVNADRDRLTEFVDGLISDYQGERAAGIAEYVAKLSEALTRQNQVKVAALKALVKAASSEDDDDDDFSHEIGPAFESDVDEGSN